jgi:hypothetical protein
MARAITKKKRVDTQRKSKVPTEMPLKPINYMIIAGGAVFILITYIILAENDTVYGFIPLNLVPILLFIGYLIIVPIGILYRKKKNDGISQNQSQPAAK